MKKASTATPVAPFQPSPGVLNDEQIGRFKTLSEDIVELPIESIKPYSLIPDYRDPTESTLPVIIQTPEGYHCIDGWNLIVQAKAASETNIRCYVATIEDHSDIELAIRKTSIRTKPQGGTGSFSELVRNTRLLRNLIIETTENPIVFSHGGSRRGANFTNNTEDDLCEMLAERLGKHRTTINHYFNFGRYLNDATLATFVTTDTGRTWKVTERIKKLLLKRSPLRCWNGTVNIRRLEK